MFAYCLNSPVQFMDQTGTLVALANSGGCYNPGANNWVLTTGLIMLGIVLRNGQMILLEQDTLQLQLLLKEKWNIYLTHCLLPQKLVRKLLTQFLSAEIRLNPYQCMQNLMLTTSLILLLELDSIFPILHWT